MLIRHPSVLDDLKHYAGLIAEDDLNAALRFVDAVEETLNDITENPYLSTAVDFGFSSRGINEREPDCQDPNTEPSLWPILRGLVRTAHDLYRCGAVAFPPHPPLRSK